MCVLCACACACVRVRAYSCVLCIAPQRGAVWLRPGPVRASAPCSVSARCIGADRVTCHSLCAQEKLIDHLEAGESCIQSNKECTRPHLTAASKLRRAQTERFKLLREDESVQDRVSETAAVKLPNGASIVLARFLPYNFQNTTGREADPAAGGSMYSIVADSKRWLHIVEVAGAGTGNTVLSQESGHTGAITSMAIDPRHLPEYKILTGSSDGEVRMHTLNAPPRKRTGSRQAPAGEKQPSANQSDTWVPVLALSAQYSPSSGERYHWRARPPRGEKCFDPPFCPILRCNA